MIPVPPSAPHLLGPSSSPRAQVCALASVSLPVPPFQPVSARELCWVHRGPARNAISSESISAALSSPEFPGLGHTLLGDWPPPPLLAPFPIWTERPGRQPLGLTPGSGNSGFLPGARCRLLSVGRLITMSGVLFWLQL